MDKPTAFVGRDAFSHVWLTEPKAVAHIEPGAIVEFDLLESSCGQLGRDSTPADIARLDFDRVDQVHGSVTVEGAAAGDTLIVEFLELVPADWGWTAIIPGFGLLSPDFPDPALRISTIGDEDRIEFLPGIFVEKAPFCGVIGVAPGAGPLSTIPPDRHGGNMDTKDLVAGSTIEIPVFQAGAHLSLGDGHAAQGDGEVCGTAVETPMRAIVRVDIRKHHARPVPVIHGASHRRPHSGGEYITMGIGPDLYGASADATRRMIDWLASEHGLAVGDAYMLCSVAADLHISEIVDRPNFVVTAHFPLPAFG